MVGRVVRCVKPKLNGHSVHEAHGSPGNAELPTSVRPASDDGGACRGIGQQPVGLRHLSEDGLDLHPHVFERGGDAIRMPQPTEAIERSSCGLCRRAFREPERGERRLGLEVRSATTNLSRTELGRSARRR